MWQVLLYSALAGLITIVGIALVRLWHHQALRYSHLINSFAGGLMLNAAVGVLLPDAIREGGHEAALYALGGFVVFLALEALLVFHSGAEIHYSQSGRASARGIVYFWGLFLHSLLDGVIIATGFAASGQLGIVASIAVIGHELPEGITTFSLLMDKLPERKAMRMALAVALATPLGGLVGAALLPVLAPELLAGALALVAGSFIYIAAADIVPEIREDRPVLNIACMIAGIAFLVIVHSFAPH